MKRTALGVALIIALAGPTKADFDAGKAAFERGDYATAFGELGPLANGDDAEAQWLIGVMYREALGTVRNYNQAIKWLSIAAAYGSPAAQHDLAAMYDEGSGVIQDHADAAGLVVHRRRAGLCRGAEQARRDVLQWAGRRA